MAILLASVMVVFSSGRLIEQLRAENKESRASNLQVKRSSMCCRHLVVAGR